MTGKRGFLRSKWFLAGSTIVAILIAISVGREFYLNYTMQQDIRALEAEAKRLEVRRLELLDLAKKFESGEFLEREARLELGLQKPGEHVVVVQPAAGEERPARRGPRTNPERWWDYFIYRNQ